MQSTGEEDGEDTVGWLNAALGRVAWDFLSEPHWTELVSKKIQMKLSKIRVSRAHQKCWKFKQADKSKS